MWNQVGWLYTRSSVKCEGQIKNKRESHTVYIYKYSNNRSQIEPSNCPTHTYTQSYIDPKSRQWHCDREAATMQWKWTKHFNTWCSHMNAVNATSCISESIKEAVQCSAEGMGRDAQVEYKIPLEMACSGKQFWTNQPHTQIHTHHTHRWADALIAFSNWQMWTN